MNKIGVVMSLFCISLCAMESIDTNNSSVFPPFQYAQWMPVIFDTYGNPYAISQVIPLDPTLHDHNLYAKKWEKHWDAYYTLSTNMYEIALALHEKKVVGIEKQVQKIAYEIEDLLAQEGDNKEQVKANCLELLKKNGAYSRLAISHDAAIAAQHEYLMRLLEPLPTPMQVRTTKKSTKTKCHVKKNMILAQSSEPILEVSSSCDNDTIQNMQEIRKNDALSSQQECSPVMIQPAERCKHVSRPKQQKKNPQSKSVSFTINEPTDEEFKQWEQQQKELARAHQEQPAFLIKRRSCKKKKRTKAINKQEKHSKAQHHTEESINQKGSSIESMVDKFTLALQMIDDNPQQSIELFEEIVLDQSCADLQGEASVQLAYLYSGVRIPLKRKIKKNNAKAIAHYNRAYQLRMQDKDPLFFSRGLDALLQVRDWDALEMWINGTQTHVAHAPFIKIVCALHKNDFIQACQLFALLRNYHVPYKSIGHKKCMEILDAWSEKHIPDLMESLWKYFDIHKTRKRGSEKESMAISDDDRMRLNMLFELSSWYVRCSKHIGSRAWKCRQHLIPEVDLKKILKKEESSRINNSYLIVALANMGHIPALLFAIDNPEMNLYDETNMEYIQNLYHYREHLTPQQLESVMNSVEKKVYQEGSIRGLLILYAHAVEHKRLPELLDALERTMPSFRLMSYSHDPLATADIEKVGYLQPLLMLPDTDRPAVRLLSHFITMYQRELVPLSNELDLSHIEQALKGLKRTFEGCIDTQPVIMDLYGILGSGYIFRYPDKREKGALYLQKAFERRGKQKGTLGATIYLMYLLKYHSEKRNFVLQEANAIIDEDGPYVMSLLVELCLHALDTNNKDLAQHYLNKYMEIAEKHNVDCSKWNDALVKIHEKIQGKKVTIKQLREKKKSMKTVLAEPLKIVSISSEDRLDDMISSLQYWCSE